MPAILIEHPRHGRMHVYSPEELAKHKAWGWDEVKKSPEKEIKKRGRINGVNKS